MPRANHTLIRAPTELVTVTKYKTSLQLQTMNFIVLYQLPDVEHLKGIMRQGGYSLIEK